MFCHVILRNFKISLGFLLPLFSQLSILVSSRQALQELLNRISRIRRVVLWLVLLLLQLVVVLLLSVFFVN